MQRTPMKQDAVAAIASWNNVIINKPHRAASSYKERSGSLESLSGYLL